MNTTEKKTLAITSNLAECLAHHLHEKSNLLAPDAEDILGLLGYMRSDSVRLGPRLKNGAWIEQVRLDAVDMFSRTSGGTLLTCWAIKAADRINRESALASVPQKVEKDKDGHALLAGEKRWAFEQLERDIARLQSSIPFLEGQIQDSTERIRFTEIEQSESDFADFRFTRLEYLTNERESLAAFEKELADVKEILRLRQLARDNFDASASDTPSGAAGSTPQATSDPRGVERAATPA